MSLYEYDEEKQLEMERSEAEERGRAEGEMIGEARGRAQGRTEGESYGIELTKSVFKLHLAGSSPEEIAEKCGITVEQVKEILE